MLINIGGLWESPIVIADERSISWAVDSEINDYEYERATLRSYNKEFYTASADHDVIDFIYFKSLTPEECDQEVMNLHCDAINSSGAFHENKLKTCYGYKDVKQIPPTKQSDKDLEKCEQDALRNLLSTKSERKKRDIKVHLDLNALRVRSSTTKDRHSKVNTAKGVRDRRVRLSVSTAIQLYNLQDKLGLQQPSKALDWLMTKAKSAIDELPVWKI